MNAGTISITGAAAIILVWTGGASHLDGKRFKNYANLDAYLADPTGQLNISRN